MLDALHYHGIRSLEKNRILEIGCGSGDILRDLIKWGARPENIVGIDLLPERVAEARHLCPRAMEIREGNAAFTEFENEFFDIIVQSTVFTSILDDSLKQQLALEMYRVLKPEGFILWYDYHVNNPWNADVRGVKAGEVRALFPRCEVRLQKITLAPPIVRVLAPRSWLLCHILSKIPWLRTHYLGVIRK